MKKIKGKVVFLRTDSDNCICCKGNHVFCKYIEYKKEEEVHVALDDYLRGMVQKFIRDKEGKEIEIIIKEVSPSSPEERVSK